jgi:hypothetical protein
MALVVKDRVKETSTTSGTGTLTLAGAASGFQAFSAVGDGNTTYYAVIDGTNWEVGLGTYTSSGTTLARTTVLASTNSNNAVNFSSDSKDVFVVYPASKSIYGDAEGNVTIKATETGDDKPAVLLLQTGETDIAADDALGKVQFQAPDEAAGTDAILVAAEIAAVSEGDFSSSSNATKLSFKTGASEAASEKMSLSSGGNLTLPTDGAVVGFGANSDVTLTHVHDTGLLLNSTMQLQFNDASQNITAPNATTLDINATDEVEINATTIDLNGSVDLNTISNVNTYKVGLSILQGLSGSGGTYAESNGKGFITYYDADNYTRMLAYAAAGGSPVFQSRSSSAIKSEIESNGDYQSATNSYGSTSDSRLKEHIVDSPSQWDDIKAMRVRKYAFKDEKSDKPTQLGVIAQELEASDMKGLVKTKPYMNPPADGNGGPDEPVLDADGNPTDYKTVKYSVLYMKAVKALQEAMARIESLESEMTALKARVATLEAS